MEVAECRSYRSRTVGYEVVTMPDGLSTFKVYFVSIVGRDEPARYEWEHSELSQEGFLERFAQSGVEGVGFVTAFPHITKLFRFAPAMETVVHVRAFNTVDMTSLGLDRGQGFVEFACYAEAAIGADEYHAWAAAKSVEEYMASRSSFDDGPVVSSGKLGEYAGRHRGTKAQRHRGTEAQRPVEYPIPIKRMSNVQVTPTPGRHGKAGSED